MRARIEGTVAKVINSRELVINRGSHAGVEIGMRFAVLDEPQEVIDPETKETLDPVDVAKTVVKVVRVSESSAVARTFRTYETGGALNLLRERTREVERLAVETDDGVSIGTRKDVQSGDRVIETKGDEFDVTG